MHMHIHRNPLSEQGSVCEYGIVLVKLRQTVSMAEPWRAALALKSN